MHFNGSTESNSANRKSGNAEIGYVKWVRFEPFVDAVLDAADPRSFKARAGQSGYCRAIFVSSHRIEWTFGLTTALEVLHQLEWRTRDRPAHLPSINCVVAQIAAAYVEALAYGHDSRSSQSAAFRLRGAH